MKILDGGRNYFIDAVPLGRYTIPNAPKQPWVPSLSSSSTPAMDGHPYAEAERFSVDIPYARTILEKTNQVDQIL